jgi:hypothetical protein
MIPNDLLIRIQIEMTPRTEYFETTPIGWTTASVRRTERNMGSCQPRNQPQTSNHVIPEHTNTTTNNIQLQYCLTYSSFKKII